MLNMIVEYAYNYNCLYSYYLVHILRKWDLHLAKCNIVTCHSGMRFAPKFRIVILAAFVTKDEF